MAQIIARVREILQVELSFLIFFETPTIAAIAKHVESADKTALAQPSIQSIPKTGGKEQPLSFSQQRMWFLDQLDPGTPAYNRPSSIRLTGQLNIAALEKSLNEIIRRHEVLRAHFPMIKGNPIQVITSNLNLTLSVTDLSDCPDMETEAIRLAASEAQQSFDLAKSPLIRAGLVRLNQEVHVLLLTMHHIVFDGWSMGVLLRELAALYEAFCTGKPSPLAKLPVQYVDFAHWQRQWLQGKTLDFQISYWKQKLADLTVLNLPTDRARPAVQTFRGGRQSLVLSKGLSDSLKALSQQKNVTLFMTLLAAFQTLLHRYTGQDDIIVGSPIAGRHLVETEKLIGVFINTLVLRTDFSGNPTFQALLARVRETALGAYAHQTLPFEKLVEELQPERDLNRTPLFQVLFQFRNIPNETLEVQGLRLDEFEFDTGVTQLDLALDMVDKPEGLFCVLRYNTDLFEIETIKRMGEHFQILLEGIVVSPDILISAYSLVTPQSLQLLPDPSIRLPEPPYELATTLFTYWVNRTPRQIAVSQDDYLYTYSELYEGAHSLANALLNHGLERGDVVAVFGSRCFGVIASIIAVFLSGGVLLTIENNLPSYRQQLMLREARAKYLLYIGERRHEDEWIWQSLTTIRVTPDTGLAIDLEEDNLRPISLPELSADEAAYIFFTSGTTGVPKGVLGCHKGVSHFINWQRQQFAISSQDRIAQLTGLSFDVILREIFLPLTCGATLCLPPELDSAKMLLWLEREQISIIHTVPARAQSWLVNVPPEVSLRALRWVFLAGEPLTDKLVCQWREVFPDSGEIVNLYGSTETTMVKCYYRIPAALFPTPQGIQPIGLPLPETQALVLTKTNQLCSIGEPGEIVLRTPFMSLGYINASKENQRRFIKNPFRNDERDWLYYTGDRGRYRPDGSLDFLCRLDNQVKIRGVRIELGEIETVLGKHPQVQLAVVIAREDHSDDKRLVAYVVHNHKPISITSELHSFLKQKLPDYMVPSAFVRLDAIPLTPNGKVDRRALPAPDQTRPDLEETFVAPSTPVEERLAGIWAEVLHREPIGIHDNFFELGGHSLLATQVISRISEAFAVELPLRSLFETPTVAGLAERITLRLTVADDDIAELLAELEGLSEEEAQLLLTKDMLMGKDG